MNLNEYVMKKYRGKTGWFLEEIATVSNQQRLQKIISNQKYLDGDHKILSAPGFMHAGKLVEPNKIVINLARQLISWQTAFLLKNNVTMVGNERVADELNEINKRAKYDLHNKDILKKLLCFGECAEYVYLEHGRIKSKVISPNNYTPVFNRHGELIGLIEHYTWNGISYYVVYDNEMVQEYSMESGKLKLDSQYASLSGLPVIYSTADSIGTGSARSDLEDWKGILDNMERLISKYSDSFHIFMSPLPVLSGQELKGESLNRNIAGQGLLLDDNAEFKYASTKMDSATFNSLYKQLNQILLDVSATPAVAMGLDAISNVSETTIKLMFSLSDVKGNENEQYLKRGLYVRASKIRTLLEYRGFTMTDDEFYSLDYSFSYNIPMNEKEIIENLKTLKDIGNYSLESGLEKNPYVEDVQMEKERLTQEGVITKGELH